MPQEQCRRGSARTRRPDRELGRVLTEAVKHCGLLAAVLIGTTPCLAQESVSRTRVTGLVEVAGNALFGATANLEVNFSPKLGIRAGGGLDFYSQTAVFPIQAFVLDGAGPSKIEFAAGVNIAHEHLSGDWHWDGTKPFLTGFVGYRYQRPGALLFRVGVVPLFWTNTKLPWVAVGIGGGF